MQKINALKNAQKISLRPTLLALAITQSLLVPSAQAATILVTETGEGGAGCTLREAVAWINTPLTPPPGCTSSGAGFNDQINFSVASVTLSNGELDINKDITIDGGAAGVNISSDGSSRILTLDENPTEITLNNLSLSGGSATLGGAIYARGVSLNLNDTVVSGNTASSKGGGIYASVRSGVSLNSSTISHNFATDQGGAIYAANSTIELTDSLITNNDADSGRGGGIALTISDLIIANSTLSNNSAGVNGGGIFALNNSSVVLTNSTISKNSAQEGAGISTLSNVALNIYNSTISDNEARQTTGRDIGIGAGIEAFSSTVSLSNSTVSNNFADSRGAGLFISSSTLVLNNSTVSSNTIKSSSFGGAGGLQIRHTSTVTLNNSIIANSSTLINGEASKDCTVFGNPSVITADAHNIIEIDDCATNALNLDPKLGPLAFNGGPTKTHGLFAGSPALDTADDMICADPTTINNLDQRGEVRPEGGHCDMGAFEGTISSSGGFFVIPAENGKTVIFSL